MNIIWLGWIVILAEESVSQDGKGRLCSHEPCLAEQCTDGCLASGPQRAHVTYTGMIPEQEPVLGSQSYSFPCSGLPFYVHLEGTHPALLQSALDTLVGKSCPLSEGLSAVRVEMLSCPESRLTISLWMCMCHLSEKMVSCLKGKTRQFSPFCWGPWCRSSSIKIGMLLDGW